MCLGDYKLKVGEMQLSSQWSSYFHASINRSACLWCSPQEINDSWEFKSKQARTIGWVYLIVLGYLCLKLISQTKTWWCPLAALLLSLLSVVNFHIFKLIFHVLMYPLEPLSFTLLNTSTIKIPAIIFLFHRLEEIWETFSSAELSL